MRNEIKFYGRVRWTHVLSRLHLRLSINSIQFLPNVSPNFSLDGWVHLEYGDSVIIIFLEIFNPNHLYLKISLNLKLLWPSAHEVALPLKFNCEHVHREWMMLMTRPWVEALRDSGPVHTSNVTMWNKNGKWLATEK
jgi:hypothetical protein